MFSQIIYIIKFNEYLAITGPLSSCSSFDRSQSNSIFIIYASEDVESAIQLYNDLKSSGFNPWLDKKSILQGQNWDNKIKKAIKTCMCIIILFSSNLVDKISYIQKEIKESIREQQNFPKSFIFIMPSRLNECKISYQDIEKIQYVDLFPDWNEGFNKILESMNLSNLKKIKEEGTEKVSNAVNINKIKERISYSRKY